MNYRINPDFNINCGFTVNSQYILEALNLTNQILESLPASVYRSIDYKTTSAIIGAIFCDILANLTDSIVNPIEKGHPDLIPKEGATAPEQVLRNYPVGLEVKCTIGNITQGSNLRAGQTRISVLTGITWQAHYREVRQLLGLVWDFVESTHEFNYPKITGVFYSDNLEVQDWGEISGTTGRNTKVTGIKSSGRAKMGKGWIALLDEPEYLKRYQRLLGFTIN